MRYLKTIGHFWRWVCVAFYRDGCAQRASALTFTSLLALVPLAVVMLSVLSVLPLFSRLSTQLQTFVFANFVPSTGQVVQQYLAIFTQQANRLPVIGLLFLVITALLMMVSIENALNGIWKVRYTRQLSGSLLLYWAMLTLGPLLLGFSVLFSSYLGSLHIWQSVHTSLIRSHELLWSLPLLCEFVGFSFLYLVVPHCRVRVLHALTGALVATILFELTKYGFGYYVRFFPTVTLLYGALATIPLFLLWVYCAWLIFLFGAEIVNGLRYRQAQRSVHYVPFFVLAYRILGHLYHAQQQKTTVSLQALLSAEPYGSIPAITKVLSRLQETGFLQETERERYVLSADLHVLTLHTLYQTLAWFLPEQLDAPAQDTWNQNLAKCLSDFSAHNKGALSATLSELYAEGKIE